MLSSIGFLRDHHCYHNNKLVEVGYC